MKLLSCRANVSKACYNGKPDDQESPMADDGTYDGETVICDRCYLLIEPFMKMNQPNVPAVADQALWIYKDNLDYLMKSDDPEQLRRKALETAAGATPNSPLYNSAAACAAMAQVEIERREEI